MRPRNSCLAMKAGAASAEAAHGLYSRECHGARRAVDGYTEAPSAKQKSQLTSFSRELTERRSALDAAVSGEVAELNRANRGECRSPDSGKTGRTPDISIIKRRREPGDELGDFGVVWPVLSSFSKRFESSLPIAQPGMRPTQD